MPGVCDAGIQPDNPPSYFAAVSAPGGGTADGHDRPATGLWWQATFAMGHLASPMTIPIRSGRVNRRARIPARLPIMKEARA